ncbi:MAG: precorrin-3B synthase [Gordonia sp. (in: high G+C Gram-positive bacteria)]
MNSPARPARDRCPGVFTPHAAADGALARIRLLGGAIGPDQLQVLADVAANHGDGFVELTSRANLQLRAITDVDAVADAIIAAGLVPTGTHEKVRNIEVSPLTGRVGGLVDMRPSAAELDRQLRADDSLATLSGRFLFGFDDGRGDIVRARPDVCACARANAGSVIIELVVDGEMIGWVPGAGDTAVSALTGIMLGVARDLLDLDPAAWRVADLDLAGRAALLDRARDRLGSIIVGQDRGSAVDALSDKTPDPDADAPLVGWFDQDDGRVLLGAVVEHGRLPARLAEFLAAIGAPIVFTPHREILICDLAEGVAETVVRVLAPMGLIFDAESPWARISCCAGAPGCANSLAHVRDDVSARIASGAAPTDREHWVGCARGCGSPAGPHLRVEASGSGYRTDRLGI